RNPKVSFCVVDKDQIVPEEFTTYFRSVIVFGKARLITDLEEMRAPHDLLCEKYCPHQTQEEKEAEFNKGEHHMLYIEITIEHMTGKQARELMPPMHKPH
ncbi:MAG: pyridoxamine 5'-phosphate oxidase family protein, partial [Bacteroidaceae bacterium]|nr:pyridoxamine 5'-phosphate oxidase family protein [Bacteroidaceae bacterium]